MLKCTMLQLPLAVAAEIYAHAREDADTSPPRECVGVVVCHVNTHSPRVIRLKNSAADPEHHFEVDEKDVHRLYRQLHKSAEYIAVVYHSHLTVQAVPSANDVANADIEDATYVIVAPNSRGRQLRAWKIADGDAREMPLQVVLTAP